MLGINKTENLEIFTPQNFTEFIGQNRAKKIAGIMISAAKIDNRSLPNIMLTGGYGLGKTSLARIMYKEMGIEPKIVDAQVFNKEIPPLNKPIIIDEIHNLKPEVADSLNILLDSGRAKIIGCTTNSGLLPAPFKSRFRSINLESYTVSEIQHIITLASLRKEVLLSGSILRDVATRSRLNPRVALNHMAFMFDYMTVNGLLSLTVSQVRDAFNTLGIDAKGFGSQDYQYMSALSDRPVGLAHISAVTGIDSKTIESEIEPYLLQTRHIDRLPRGRIKLKEI